VDVTFPARVCGPPTSANGGFTAGTLARHLAGAVEVTLRRPPPLDRVLRLDVVGDRVELHDDDALVAEAVVYRGALDPAAPVGWSDAVRAARTSWFADGDRHPFPTCFVCGPARPDGLRLFAGAVPGRGRFAAPWVPAEVTEEIVWSALDCPSGAPAFADVTRPGPFVLGRIAARIDRLPVPGARHVVTSWELERDGRKSVAASAIHDADGGLCAVARATWIELQPE